jgi:Tol biopolymer transport system component
LPCSGRRSRSQLPAGRRPGLARRPALIAFTRGAGEQGLPVLYEIGADGGRARRLTAEFAETPAWSPDGTRIVYSAPFQDAFGLHVLKPGGQPRLLAPRGTDGGDCEGNDCAYDNPSWSPDGRFVACTYVTGASSREPTAVIAIVPGSGGKTVFLTNGTADREPAWSPASDALAFTGAGGIRVVGVRGGASRLLAKGDLGQAAWSRTRRIAFAGPLGISMVNSDGSGRRLVARVPGAQWPRWSPDGALIVFETVRPSGFAGPLYVVRADGTKLHRLSRPGGAGGHPTWSPDGRLIAYVDGPGVGRDGPLVVVAPDGTHRRQLTRSESDADPAWQP